MKRWKCSIGGAGFKRMRFLVVLVGLLSAGSFTAYAGWEHDNTNWYYYDNASKRYLENEWLHNSDKDRFYYLGEGGVMQTGWVNIDGYQYYLEENDENTRGGLYTNTTTPDGAIIGADGVKVANPNEKFIQN